MATLTKLINEFGANAFIYADAGNGCAYGENGQALDFDDDAAEKYGDIELVAMESTAKSEDGFDVTFASEWIVTGEGSNPYRFRVMF